MNNERQFLSEIIRGGEQYCVIRDLFEKIPPECNKCGLLRFCENPRSNDDIANLVISVGRNLYRRDFFEIAEEDGYYD